METTETTYVPELFGEQPKNGNGNVHMLKPREDGTYLSAYQAGLAVGKEEGYRRGYREGFSDGSKLGNPTRPAAMPRFAPTMPAREPAAVGPARLRGLPCAKCRCASYTDEVKCPACGTPKASAAGNQPAEVAVDVSQVKSPPSRRRRNRSAQAMASES